MLEPLRMIPGPYFLLLLVGLTGLGIYLHFFRSWGAGRLNPIAEMRLSPYELAYLARGPGGVIETALATADANGLIQVDASSGPAIPLPSARPDDPILAELLKELGELGGSLRGLKLTESIKVLQSDLMEAGLLDRSTSGQVALRGLAIFGTIEVLAFLKLSLALTYNKPAGFLFVLVFVIAGILAVGLVAKGRRGYPTAAGRRCVADRRQALEPLLFDAQASRTRSDARPLMTSVFGFQELSGSMWGAAIPLAGIAIATSPLWMNPPAASGAFSSGSSGGDGGWSTSSGSSDSGCGGGSSGGDSGCGGGGGCGGCGGGGGD
ncbi:MAG: TIGR04222 domain-containing membrane protein [Fibrobacterota bacterium]|nr:MAG: TIGR04222 domain-containing membrane protein [Fibrobacterota bacterium]